MQGSGPLARQGLRKISGFAAVAGYLGFLLVLQGFMGNFLDGLRGCVLTGQMLGSSWCLLIGIRSRFETPRPETPKSLKPDSCERAPL